MGIEFFLVSNDLTIKLKDSSLVNFNHYDRNICTAFMFRHLSSLLHCRWNEQVIKRAALLLLLEAMQLQLTPIHETG